MAGLGAPTAEVQVWNVAEAGCGPSGHTGRVLALSFSADQKKFGRHATDAAAMAAAVTTAAYSPPLSRIVASVTVVKFVQRRHPFSWGVP